MSQSLAKVTVHIVFSTKNHERFLGDADLRRDLYAYMAKILRDNVDSPALLINGVEDHVHILCQLSRKFPIMKVIQEAKTETTKWLKKQGAGLTTFGWQTGYGIFSVSESNIPQVRDYIERQEEHHRRLSFQDEFRKLCERHNVAIDERYVWD